MKFLGFIVLTAFFLGCSGENSSPPTEAVDASKTTSSELNSDTQERVPRLLDLPATSDSQDSTVSAGTEAGGLQWDAPDSWIEEAPSNRMRIAQYRLPQTEASAQPATVVVFHFGPGQGGAPEANIARWASQFQQPDGSDPQEALIVETSSQGPLKFWRAEIQGTYDGGMTMMGAEAMALDQWMLLAAIIETPQGPYFFKGTGPVEVMEQNREAFAALLQSARF